MLEEIPRNKDVDEPTSDSRCEGLFIFDTEMYRRMGVSEKVGRVAVRELEKRQVFPAKDPLFGNKRYWPAVQAFLDARAGIGPPPPKRRSGQSD